MSEGTIIHCRCQRRTWYRILAVLLPDGRLEMRQDGKSTIFTGGSVTLACRRCGFSEEIALDKQAERVVA